MSKIKNLNKSILSVFLIGMFVFSVSQPQKASASFSLFGHEIPSNFDDFVNIAFSKFIVKKSVDKPEVKEVLVTENNDDETGNIPNGIDGNPSSEDVNKLVNNSNVLNNVPVNLGDDVEVTKDGDITKIVVDETTVNNILKDHSQGISVAGYTLNDLSVELENGIIIANANINDETALKVVLESSEDGKNLKVSDIENPSKDISFIKMFILKKIVSSFTLSDIQGYLPDGAGQIVKLKPMQNAIEIWMKF